MDLLNKIGVIGLGLIGGSIAKSLKKNKPRIEIGSLNRACPDLQGAVEQKSVDYVFNE